MKRGALWRISVTTSAEAEEAITELMARTFGQPVASYSDVETGATTVTIYFSAKPDWSRARRANLKAELRRIETCGLQVGPAKAVLARVRREDWAESWKRHFKPIQIGPRLLVKPSWSRLPPRKGQALVVLDPGLSFGTGQHPTTEFCLRQLALRRRPGEAQSLLDIGTGSGILAIAAAKLGYRPVTAFDFDPQAVQIAHANAKRNRVEQKLRLFQRDVTELPRTGNRTYSLVCANLMADLLIAQRERILSQLADQGVLILAGILRSEFLDVQRAYEAAGLHLVSSQARQEWRSGSFARRTGTGSR